jgi:hypothetical protein
MLHDETHSGEVPVQAYGAQLGSPGVPITFSEQSPRLPTLLQPLHAPPHAEVQHTPSVQNAVMHSSSTVHGVPFASFFRQLPFTSR